MSNKTAFVFPGQGSQTVGMLSELYQQHSIVRDTFSEASDALGIDMSTMALEGPAELQNATEHTQPLMLMASMAVWRLWNELGGFKPDYLSGHSLGEYTALCAAGVFDFSDAMRIVHTRGQLMQSAVPMGVGAMAAILGLEDQQVIDVCAQAAEGEVVSAVNFNSTGQVVIAGHSAAVERAIALAKETGARKALPLPISVPCHSSLLVPAAAKLAEVIDAVQINAPSIPVVQNLTANVASDMTQLRANLLEHLYSPVLWSDCVRFLAAQGVASVYECGPGKVLSGLNKRIDRSLTLASLGCEATIMKALEG